MDHSNTAQCSFEELNVVQRSELLECAPFVGSASLLLLTSLLFYS